jgi:hypothetical protein
MRKAADAEGMRLADWMRDALFAKLEATRRKATRKNPKPRKSR